MYSKPIVKFDEELFESVYMASGDCYYVANVMYQKPETGRGDYRIQINASHNATDGHHSGEQILTITFSQPVKYKDSNGTLINGDGSCSIRIRYKYHNNDKDNIGLGDVIVESDAGLAVIGCSLECNHNCGQH